MKENEELKEILKQIEEMNIEIDRMGERGENLKEKLTKMKSVTLSKLIPPYKIDENLDYTKWVDNPDQENIPVVNVSLAIYHLGEIGLAIRDSMVKGVREVKFKEFERIYKKLSLGFQEQLKVVYEALKFEIKERK